MKKFLLMSMTAAALAVPAFASDATDIQALKAQLDAQKAEIEALKAQVGGSQYITRDEASRLIQNELNSTVDQKIETGLAQMKDSSPILSLGKNIDNLSITGDVRVRWNNQRATYKTAAASAAAGGSTGSDRTLNRSTFNTQLRLGGIWKAEGWEVGLGIVGGAANDARSNNRNFSAAGGATPTFSKSGVWLDYAYAKHTWGDLSLTVGQQKNPYVSTWILFDTDVRPAGVTLQYSNSGFFGTAGVYDVMEPGALNTNTGYLGAIQGGYKYTDDSTEALIALAWYKYGKHGTSAAQAAIADPNYAYDLGDVYAHLRYKFDPITATVYGEIVKNFADNKLRNGGFNGIATNPSSEDTAYIIGAKLGYEEWVLNYGYAHIEADSVNPVVNDGDFAAAGNQALAANLKGHKVELTYNVTKNLALAARAWFVKEIIQNPRSTGLKSGRLYMVDATWSF